LAEIDKFLEMAANLGASDIHIAAGAPPIIRHHGTLKKGKFRALEAEDTERLIMEILNEDQKKSFEEEWELDFSYELPNVGRYRTNVFRQRRGLDAAFRLVPESPPTLDELGFPASIQRLLSYRQGLILVTGKAGSGKTTTLAGMINHLNLTRREHIITVEDPIENVHKPKQAVVVQQELYTDTLSFPRALIHILRQDPDVIGIGEMRDPDSISTALEAAETGHLVLATLHTPDTSQTLDRIVAGFPTYNQNQIRAQLAGAIQAIIAQKLIQKGDRSGVCLAYELLISNPAVRNVIRDNETYKLYSIMQTGLKEVMITFDACLAAHYRNARSATTLRSLTRPGRTK